MKIIKKILMGMGVLFVLLLGLIIFLAGASSDFKEKHEGFVKSYIQDFSQKWSVEHVADRMTNEMIAAINTPNGLHAISVFRSFGKLQKISDMELDNYSTHTNGPTVGIFKFKAHFERAMALVTVTVHEMDNTPRVQYFHMEPVTTVKNEKKINV